MVSKAALANSDSDESIRVTHNNNAMTDVLPECKQKEKNTPKNSGNHSYYILRKKAGMLERKWKFHISKNCFGKFSNEHP